MPEEIQNAVETGIAAVLNKFSKKGRKIKITYCDDIKKPDGGSVAAVFDKNDLGITIAPTLLDRTMRTSLSTPHKAFIAAAHETMHLVQQEVLGMTLDPTIHLTPDQHGEHPQEIQAYREALIAFKEVWPHFSGYMQTGERKYHY